MAWKLARSSEYICSLLICVYILICMYVCMYVCWIYICHCFSCEKPDPKLTETAYLTPFEQHSFSIKNTFSALLAICAGNSLVTGEFPAQRPVMRSFDVFFGLRLNKRLSKQSWGWWLETPSSPLWRHCNDHTSVSFPVEFQSLDEEGNK